MRLIAKDSFYTDETKHVSAKQEFEISSDETGKDLVKRGLAEEVTVTTENSPAAKAQTGPQNKAQTKPQNKAQTVAPKSK